MWGHSARNAAATDERLKEGGVREPPGAGLPTVAYTDILMATLPARDRGVAGSLALLLSLAVPRAWSRRSCPFAGSALMICRTAGFQPAS
jgi:hypothetical protein